MPLHSTPTTMPATYRPLLSPILTTLLLAGLPIGAAAADIESAIVFRNLGHLQSSDVLVTEDFAFMTAAVTGLGSFAGPAASGTLTLPDATVVALQSKPAGLFDYSPPGSPGLAAMNAAQPTGTYSFTLSDGMGGVATTQLTYLADNYAPAPQLANGSYSALQGADAGQAITLSVTPLDASGADLGLVFFGIYRLSDNALVYNQSFAAASTSSFTLGAGVLEAGTAYSFDLDHSRRSFQAVSGSAQFPNVLSFESRTYGFFTTAAAVPEPASFGLMALGLLVVGGLTSQRLRLPRPAGQGAEPQPCC